MSHSLSDFNSQEIHGFSCNHAGCDEEFKERGSFQEVWDEARRDGWRACKVDGEWRHFCPSHASSQNLTAES